MVAAFDTITIVTTRLRFISWNVAHLVGGREARDSTIRVLRGLSPDVVLLQECDFGTVRSGYASQAMDMGDALDMQAVSFSAMPYDGGRYGLAILSRYKIDRVASVPVPGSWFVGEQRIVSLVHGPSIPGIGNIHLSRIPREAASIELSRVLRLLPDWVDVIVGDFNHPPSTELIAPWMEVSPAAMTWPAHQPAEAIDRVIVRSGTLRVHVKALSYTVSDHLPIDVEVEMK